MNTHRHLSSEELFERVSMGETPEGIAGCASCEAEASSLSGFLVELKRCDSELAVTTDWDDLLARRRIREAVAREKPHSRTLFHRFFILRPVFVSAVAASVALAVWSPLSQDADKGKQTASASPVGGGRIPSWTPLPDESEDEGLAVLAEWTPNEDEVSIARCHFACLSGLSDHEEENLLRSVAAIASRSPLTEASPL
jgi:hypothetical protein